MTSPAISNPFLRAVLIWLLLVPLAIGNGLLRESVLVRALGPELALPLSGISLSLLILFMVWLTLPWLGALNSGSAMLVGIQWLLLTLVFEFSFGRYVVGKSWSDLLAAYDVTTGNLWLLVLVVIASAPYAVAKLRSVF